jgi:hypothetical protein
MGRGERVPGDSREVAADVEGLGLGRRREGSGREERGEQEEGERRARSHGEPRFASDSVGRGLVRPFETATEPSRLCVGGRQGGGSDTSRGLSGRSGRAGRLGLRDFRRAGF